MILQGDCLEQLKTLPDESIQCCVTSPPYWGLRDYGVDGQIGLEKTPDEYVEKLVNVFREVKRVLRNDGTLFLNLGDSYFGSNQTGGTNSLEGSSKRRGRMFSKTVNGQREVSCGIGDKEPEGYQGRDYLCESLCDACRKAYLIGKSRNDNLHIPMQSFSPSLPNHEHKEFGSVHSPTSDSLNQADRSANAILDSENLQDHGGGQHLSSQESMPDLSFVPLQDDCLQKDTPSACPLCGRTSTPCVQECEHKKACTFGIASPSGASIHDKSGIFSSYLAYPNLTIPFYNVKIKPKDLVGIPWRVAFALQADGWYLRSDIIWHKPNPMPESVTDRPTKSHEYIFLLTKSARYYYDNEAVKEEATGYDGRKDTVYHGGLKDMACTGEHKRWKRKNDGTNYGGNGSGFQNHSGYSNLENPFVRNKRSVWTVTTQPYKEAHFATFPEEIPRTCILAGSKKGDTILDPFSGAGTTGVVAEKLNRKYIGIELNPQYTKMSEDRIYNVQPLFAGIF